MPRKSLSDTASITRPGVAARDARAADPTHIAAIAASIDDARLYRRKAAQAQIGIGTTKFYELVKRGEIEVRKIGAATVVPGYSLRHFIEKTIAA